MNRPASLIAFCALLGAAGASHAVEYATVVSSTPVVVGVPVARRVCSDAQQLVQPQPSGAGAVIGAIAGGVLGHNIGGGLGRAAATGLGAVAGSIIGDQVEANANPPVAVPVRNCRTVTSEEQRTVGYDVMYDYAGQRYSTRVPRDPGPRMAIDVRPALGSSDAQPSAQPAAPGDYQPVPAAGAAPPQVVYGAAPVVYADPYLVPLIVPSISLGFGYYGGYYGGGHRRWR